MAQRTTVLLVDDVDGGEAAGTIAFGVEGVEYEIDLTAANAAELRRAMSLYVEHGRRTGGRPGTRAAAVGASAPRTPLVDSTAVRAWARAHGIAVNARGRLTADVVARFVAAGN